MANIKCCLLGCRKRWTRRQWDRDGGRIRLIGWVCLRCDLMRWKLFFVGFDREQVPALLHLFEHFEAAGEPNGYVVRCRVPLRE